MKTAIKICLFSIGLGLHGCGDKQLVGDPPPSPPPAERAAATVLLKGENLSQMLKPSELEDEYDNTVSTMNGVVTRRFSLPCRRSERRSTHQPGSHPTGKSS